jgi:hypothetical protein
MKNGIWTIFVSKTGRCDDPTYQLWVETEREDIYKRALADVEPRGWKVARIYKPDTELGVPDFGKCVDPLTP